MRARPEYLASQRQYYRTRPQEWINQWAMTYDPRLAGDEKRLTTMPFVMFCRQDDFVELLHQAVLAGTNVLCEKSRDMGVTWVCCAFSVWLWLYWPGSAVGWGSRKKDLVDKIGDPSSIFEKIRIIIKWLPPEMLPAGFSYDADVSQMKVVNRETGSTITGEVGDDIGRGGRTLVYFADESAHYEHPESVEAALSYNTSCQVDVSSVNGPASVFQRKRDSGFMWDRSRPDELRRDRTNVFVFDWTDHPDKTQEWYDDERSKKQEEGLLHLFAQEVDRNPSAAVQGTIINDLWVRAAFGAADKLGIKVTGPWIAALDVADNDDDGDVNALTLRHGIQLEDFETWGERDPGVTTRRSIGMIEDFAPVEVEYDCIGIGAAVKTEVNRLKDDRKMPRGIVFVPWNAAAHPNDPERRVVPDDPKSPLNEDFYQNLKAQAWWQVARRFERTYRALNEPGFTWTEDDVVSINPDMPAHKRLQLIKELTQATIGKSTSLKLLVNKKPDGARSPNVADSVVMNLWPADVRRPMVVNREVVDRSAHPLGKKSAFTSVFNKSGGVFKKPAATYVTSRNDY